MILLRTVLHGPFAPFCKAHLIRVRNELDAGKDVTIVVSGAEASRSSRLPWTAEERLEMAQTVLAEYGERVACLVSEHPNSAEDERQQIIDLLASEAQRSAVPREMDFVARSCGFYRTDDLAAEEAAARAAFFNGDDQALKAVVPEPVFEALACFHKADWFEGLAEEQRYIEAYKASWAAAPYAPTFVTVDMVIIHAGRVLLIKRGGQPGRGLWALPGGFLDGNERLKDAALRELREETGLDLGWDDEHLSLKGSHVFDDPERSARGRTITHAFHVELTADQTPIVTGSDDAAEAQWVPIKDLPSLRNHFFEDHGHILDYFLKA